MLPKPEWAYFAIADISGYTSFLAGVELRPVEIYREFMTAAARWMFAAKL